MGRDGGTRTAPDRVRLLASGGAFADLTFWRKLGVSGPDARDWLQGLVSSDLAGLSDGEARRALLLSPTGRIRADFTVAATGGELLLLQDPVQTRPVGELLSPYLLSSAVSLRDRTEELALFGLPNVRPPIDLAVPGTAAVDVLSPSCLGSGVDVITPASAREELAASLEARFHPAGNEDVEAWRVVEGRAKVGVDVMEEDLPMEAGLDSAVSPGKGCYLGQEAVARARNLGHPRRLVLPLLARGAVSPGEAIVAAGREVGEITSVTPAGDVSFAIARIRWDAREGPFSTSVGTSLEPRTA